MKILCQWVGPSIRIEAWRDWGLTMNISADVREKMFVALSAGIVALAPAVAQDNGEHPGTKPAEQNASGNRKARDNYQFHQGAKVDAQRTEVNLNIHQLDRIGKDIRPSTNGSAPHYFQYNIDLSQNSAGKNNKHVILPGCDANAQHSSKAESSKGAPFPVPGTAVTGVAGVNITKARPVEKDPCLGCGRG